MNRIVVALFSFVILSSSLFAQDSKVSEKKESFHSNMKGNALVISLEGKKKNIEKVIALSFPNNKITKEKGGLSAVMEQRIKGMYKRPLDLYWRVEKVDDDHGRVVMFLGNGFNNFLSSDKSNKDIGGVSEYLEGLQVEVRKYELQIAMDAQTKVILGAEKEQEKLEREHEKLLKNKARLETLLQENNASIDQNQDNQDNQILTIEKEKQMLEEFKFRLGELTGE